MGHVLVCGGQRGDSHELAERDVDERAKTWCLLVAKRRRYQSPG
jgi:hypothetical protein